MKLRIIAGEFKGRYITVRDDINFRPTQERVREAVANIVARKVIDAVVADVCAGSGAFGFEMISRGAKRADFIDVDRMAVVNIADNARSLGVSDRVKIIRDDVFDFVGRDDNCYDVIFYDPPYDFANLSSPEHIAKLRSLLNDKGILIYERRRLRSEKKNILRKDSNDGMTDARIFSDTVVEFYVPYSTTSK